MKLRKLTGLLILALLLQCVAPVQVAFAAGDVPAAGEVTEVSGGGDEQTPPVIDEVPVTEENPAEEVLPLEEPVSEPPSGEPSEEGSVPAPAENGQPAEEQTEEQTEVPAEEQPQEDALTEDGAEEEVVEEEETDAEAQSALQATETTMPAGATTVEAVTLDTIYYYGDEGYGFAFALKNFSNTEETWETVKEWDTTDVRIQVDDQTPVSYNLHSTSQYGGNNVSCFEAYSVFGGDYNNSLYLNKNLPFGTHTIKVAVQRTVDGEKKWYTGTVSNVVLKECASDFTSTNPSERKRYFSTKAGAGVRVGRSGALLNMALSAANPTRNPNATIAKVEVFKNEERVMPVASVTGVDSHPGYDGLLDYFFDGSTFSDLQRQIYRKLPSGYLSITTSNWFVIPWEQDVAEGFYDIIVTTSEGNTTTYEKYFYATSKPVIFEIGFRNPGALDQGQAGSVEVINRGSDYVAAYVYGLNIPDSIVPAYSYGGTAVTTGTGKSQPLCVPSEYGDEWGKVYQLKKTDAAVWNTTEDSITLPLNITVPADAIDLREDKNVEITLPYKPVYAFGNRSVRYDQASHTSYYKLTAHLAADWIDGASEIGFVTYPDGKEAFHKKNVQSFNDRGDGVIVSDEYKYEFNGTPGVYRVKDGITEYKEFSPWGKETTLSGAYYSVEDAQNSDSGDPQITAGHYYQIFHLEDMEPIVSVTASAGQTTIDSLVPDDIRWKLHPNAMYRVLEYENGGGKLVSKYAVTNFTPGINVTGVSLERGSLSMMAGDEVTLTASLYPVNAANQAVTWSVEAEPADAVTIASVDGNLLQQKIKAVKAGTATVTVKTADGGKTAVCTVMVSGSDLTGDDGHDDTSEHSSLEDKNSLWAATIADQTYSGKKLTPPVRVYDGQKRLTEKADYTVTYKNNTNAADKAAEKAPVAVIKFRGNYSGTLDKTFTIEALDLNDASATVEIAAPAVVYKENMKLPAPTVKVNGKKLKADKDYTLKYTNPDSVEVTDGKATKAGTYKITVTGKGNYSETKEVDLILADAGSQVLMSKVSVPKIATQTYVAGGVKPDTAEGFAVKYKKDKSTTVTLEKGRDYTVSYENNDKTGTATMILTGTGTAGTDGLTFVGEKRVTFKINGTPLKNAKIEKDFSKITYENTHYVWNADRKGFVYTGTAFEPAGPEGDSVTDAGDMKVDYNGTTLTRGTDYTVTYQKNTDTGKATILFTGKGAYSGTVKRTFKIVPAEIKADMITPVTSAPYTKGGAKPVPEVIFGTTPLVYGKDFTVSYANASAVNNPKKQPSYTVKGKGNFTGTVSNQNYTITAQDLGGLSIVAPDKAHSTKKNGWMSAPVITDVNGKRLKAGVDYVKPTADNYFYAGKSSGQLPAVGDAVTVTVQGKAPYYSGTLTASYRIGKADIAKGSFSIKAKTYDSGREIALTDGDFTKASVKVGKTTTDLKLGTDFRIASYQKNISKGTATVVLEGIGEYCGTKKVSFKIQAKSNG